MTHLFLQFFIAIEEISEEIREYRSDFGFFHSLRGSDSVGSIASTLAPAKDLDEELKSASTAPEPSAVADSIEIGDSLCYIYTSGTTGLPKAVNITHQRYYSVSNCSNKVTTVLSGYSDTQS